MSLWAVAALFAACAVAGAALTRLAMVWLAWRRVHDHANERSSHSGAVLRGGGWGILLAAAPPWVLAVSSDRAALGQPWLVLAGVALLVAVSAWDDRRSLPAAPRLLAQLVAVALGLGALPAGFAPLPALPQPVAMIVLALAWLWWTNLTNFLDGIDGMLGALTLVLALGAALLLAAGGGPHGAILCAVALGGAALGFLRWNWHRARVFAGDVGTIPVGYASFWLLLLAAGRGGEALPSVLALAAYPAADATVTLLRRLARGARPWQAHREHFYQLAVQAGRRHDHVVLWVVATLLACLALALLALERPPLAALVLVPVAALLRWMTRPRRVTA